MRHGGSKIITLGLAVQRVDNTIHWINHWSVDSIVCFTNTYPLYSNLSSEECYPLFEQQNWTLYLRLNSSGNCFAFLSEEALSSHNASLL